MNFPIVATVEPPHDNRDGLKPLPGKRLGKGAPDFSAGTGNNPGGVRRAELQFRRTARP